LALEAAIAETDIAVATSVVRKDRRDVGRGQTVAAMGRTTCDFLRADTIRTPIREVPRRDSCRGMPG
jgi:hypothetical protein